MKKTIYLLSVITITFLYSCSSKGDWSDSDMNACIEDGKEELKLDNELRLMISMFTDDESQFVTCACEQMEKDFDSYAAADKAINNGDRVAEEEGMKMLESCFNDEFKESMDMLEGME